MIEPCRHKNKLCPWLLMTLQQVYFPDKHDFHLWVLAFWSATVLPLVHSFILYMYYMYIENRVLFSIYRSSGMPGTYF